MKSLTAKVTTQKALIITEKTKQNNLTTCKMKTFKEIKKELNLSNSEIAEMFNYKSAMAYSNSSAKKRIENGLTNFYNLITMKELQILDEVSKGVMKKVFISPEHFPIMSKYNLGDRIGCYSYNVNDDNGNQIWKNNNIKVVLSEREMQVFELKELSNLEISNKIGVSEKSIENYRNKITSKGF